MGKEMFIEIMTHILTIEEVLMDKYDIPEEAMNEVLKINNYSREEAIDELIKSKKLNEKIVHINEFIRKLRG